MISSAWPRLSAHLAVTGIATVLFAALPAAHADTSERADRPRIGLVLGGGGARGAAHIGVLQELERQRIPVDAVAGISMGAIIGGLYAAGHSPDELEEIVSSLDWSDAFADDERRSSQRYRRKQDDRDFPVGLELGLSKGSLKLPRGAISGQKVALILRRLTLGIAEDMDFDDLPTPFRAVAADLETGEQRELGEGDLAGAIRASMAAPGIIAPVEIDGRMLVDGGLGGNVPIDTMLGMDVDIIIAVDVEFPLFQPEQIDSALDVSYQMLTILIRNQTQAQLARLTEDDILLTPALGQFGSTDFGNISEAIEPGVRAAAAAADGLAHLALDETAYASHLAMREAKIAAAPERIDFVRVKSDGRLAPQVLRARVETERGDQVDADQLSADAGALYGLHIFDRVGYRLLKDGDATGVEFAGTGRSFGQNYLKFGLSLQDDFEGSTAFDVSARLTRSAINRLGAEWRTDLQLGTRPYLRTEFYQPLSFDSRYFVAPRAGIEQSNFNLFDSEDRLARYRVTEAELGLDFGRELGSWGEIRIGAFRGEVDASLKVGDPTLPNVSADTGGVFARFAFDTQDDGQIPTNGIRGQLQWVDSSDRFGADSDIDALETSLSFVHAFGRHVVEVGALMNVSLEDTDLVQNFYQLGGFLRLSGLARGEISGPHAGVARLVYYRRTGETGGSLFDIPLYLGASLEAGNTWQRRSEISADGLITSGSLFVGLDTYFGPLYLAAGLAEGGRSNFFLSLGTPP